MKTGVRRFQQEARAASALNQTIRDMLVDVKSLKQELEFDAKMKRSTQSQSQG